MRYSSRKIVTNNGGVVPGAPRQGELPLDEILDDQEIQNILMNDRAARDAITDLVVANGREGVPGLFGNGGIPGLPPELAETDKMQKRLRTPSTVSRRIR